MHTELKMLVFSHTENNKRENTVQELNCNYYENL